MADNIGKRAKENELAENDPFAELTRIMGSDLNSLRRVSEEPAEDLALELEKELMGDVPEETEDNGFKESSGAEVIFWRQSPATPVEPQVISQDRFDHTLEPATDADEAPAAGDELDEAAGAARESWDHFALHEEPPASGDEPDAVVGAAQESWDQYAFDEEAPASDDERDAVVGAAQAGWDQFDFHENNQTLGDIQPDEPAFETESMAAGSNDHEGGPESNHLRSVANDFPQADDFAEPIQEHEAAPEPEEDDSDVSFDYSRAAAERHEFLTVEDLAAGLADLQSFEPEAEAAASELAPLVPEQPTHEEWQPSQTAFAETGAEWLASPVDEAHGEWESSRNSDDLPPDIETVDVPEKAVALTDNLDIPDVPYKEEKPAAQFDEIEEILAGAFGDIAAHADPNSDAWSDGAPSEAAAAADEDQSHEYGYDIPGMASAGAAAAFESNTFADRDRPTAYHGADAGYHEDWSPEHQSSLAPGPGVEPPVESRRFRAGSGLLMAGAVAGAVAILGGVTVFALNFGDNGDGAPVLVSADLSPVKVRPEEPGGVQIPNQDNQVYRRVSGEPADNKPEQASLISTTEDPVDLTPAAGQPALREQESPVAPTPEEETVGLAPLPGDASKDESSSADQAERPQPETSAAEALRPGSDAGAGEPTKVDDRLPGVSTGQTDNGNNNSDVVSLTPRMVRSLVVRPDGTMVPYEAPAPANPAGQSASLDASDNPADAAGVQSQGTAAAMPDSGPIPPSRPANLAAAQPQPQPAAASTQARQPQQQQQQPVEQPAQTAAAPAPTSQPAASAWSVQIASQPTPEGAQQSYQTLAQRFGNLLQGKGVNIVKAEIDGRGTFYRVRIPSASKDDAIQLCSQLKSAGGSCFVSQ